jgi:hypothetical protein
MLLWRHMLLQQQQQQQQQGCCEAQAEPAQGLVVVSFTRAFRLLLVVSSSTVWGLA